MKRLLASRGQLDADDDALARFPGFNFVFVGKAETGMPTFAAPSECQPFSRRGSWWELNKLTLVLAPIIGERFPSARKLRRGHASAVVLQRPGIAGRAWPAYRNFRGTGVVSVRHHLN